ncbi:hypothetical protein [Luteitalea sp.]
MRRRSRQCRHAQHRARDTGETYQAYLTQLAEASGITTPTREALARFDRRRKKKSSNQDWPHPVDPDAMITKMKDGRTHLAHKAVNLGLILPQLTGWGTPRGLRGRSGALASLIRADRPTGRPLGLCAGHRAPVDARADLHHERPRRCAPGVSQCLAPRAAKALLLHGTSSWPV